MFATSVPHDCVVGVGARFCCSRMQFRLCVVCVDCRQGKGECRGLTVRIYAELADIRDLFDDIVYYGKDEESKTADRFVGSGCRRTYGVRTLLERCSDEGEAFFYV